MDIMIFIRMHAKQPQHPGQVTLTCLRCVSTYLNNAVLAEESSLPNEAQPLTVRSRAFEHLKFAFHDKEHLIPC
jgi:hypothetical protein